MKKCEKQVNFLSNDTRSEMNEGDESDKDSFCDELCTFMYKRWESLLKALDTYLLCVRSEVFYESTF